MARFQFLVRRKVETASFFFETPIQILAHCTGGEGAAFLQAKNLPEECGHRARALAWANVLWPARRVRGEEAAFPQAKNLPEEWAGQKKTRIWPPGQLGPAFILTHA